MSHSILKKMKKNFLLVVYACCMMFASFTNSAIAQITANVGVNAVYNPNAFTTYRATPTTGTLANGLFTAVITKSGGDMPANSFSIIVSLAPDVAYTGATFDIPTGFTFQAISPISLVFKQTGAYNGSGLPARRVINIPVQATAPVAATGANNWLIEVQQEADYTDLVPADDAAKGRVSVADSPLPVKLTSFKVAKENNTANLFWSTTSETNSEHFEIQHSKDAKDWSIIGLVAAKGESKSKLDYTFMHKNPVTGENYYRLKMVDKDATYTYSRLQNLEFGAVSAISFFPNPVSETLFIDHGIFSEIESISIIDANGRTVYKSAVITPSGINVKRLGSGVYVIKVASSEGSSYTQKVVIIR